MHAILAVLAMTTMLATADARAQQQAAAAEDLPYAPLTAYSILRDGVPIGSHVLRFERDGPRRVVTARVRVEVRVLGVTAYRLVHDSHEVWEGDRLQQLTTATDNNGKRFAVHARRTAEGLVVARQQPADSGTAAAQFDGFAAAGTDRATLPASTLPTSLWNVRQVGQAALLHTQHGRLVRPRIVAGPRETVRTAGGPVEATRYTYSGDLRMTQWFDDRGRWVRSTFQAFDGSTIEYILQE
ncbi:MAG: hypothetical protein KIT25_15125 [Enhydrobacter sp.]|nr:MAG: hypothetical protein KIT25_15125 [Enhydrobacter sp.]